MRKKTIGKLSFGPTVDITDPCYDRDVWCRMNKVSIKQGSYTCVVWSEDGRKVLRVIIPDKNNVFPDDKKCLYPYSVQHKPTEMLIKKGGAEL